MDLWIHERIYININGSMETEMDLWRHKWIYENVNGTMEEALSNIESFSLNASKFLKSFFIFKGNTMINDEGMRILLQMIS